MSASIATSMLTIKDSWRGSWQPVQQLVYFHHIHHHHHHHLHHNPKPYSTVIIIININPILTKLSIQGLASSTGHEDLWTTLLHGPWVLNLFYFLSLMADCWWLCWLVGRQTWVVSQDAWIESGNKALAQISIGIGTVGTLAALPDYRLI